MSEKSSNDHGDFRDWWDRINIKLDKLLMLMLSLLLITQVVFLNQNTRTILSRIDRLEGSSVADSQLFIKRGEVELTIESHENTSGLVFYINGEEVPVRAGKSIKLTVKDNDVLEVSGADFSDIAVLRLSSVSDNVIVPEPGKIVYINGNLVLIDRVRLK